jgi:transcriptional regulator of acetoin/glycerol metabolism
MTGSERTTAESLTGPTDLKMLQRALEAASCNKVIAAKSPGLCRKQLYVRLRQHGLG